MSRYDRRTGLIQQVGPHAGPAAGFRSVRTAPLVFSTVDPHTLFFAENVVWKTSNSGKSWTQVSPDLTRTDSIVPANVGVYASSPTATARHGGVIYTLAPSYVDVKRIWAGSDDGLIHTTGDGGAHWTDVTPPDLRARPWSKVSLMDAGRFDAGTAYAAINTIRLDDFRPHIYRTHDGGRSWTQITNGIADGAVINVVREDPRRRGLLYAGSEDQVWVSFDDGDHWSSLRLNMPATSVRDLVIKDDDVVIGTHGRSFYVLDDVAALRQINAATVAAPVTLFKPANAIRFRFSKYPDTPIPPDEPWAQNPPDGAIIEYFIGASVAGDATLEIVEAGGRVIRTYTSRDTAMAPADIGNTPRYWIRPTLVLSAAPGFHRFVWDVHFERPVGATAAMAYPISAAPHDTPREPRGPWALPGTYTVRLTVGGRTYAQSLTINMDPRVKVPSAALREAHVLAVSLFDAMARDSMLAGAIQRVRHQIRGIRDGGGAASSLPRLVTLDTALSELAVGVGDGRRGVGRRGAPAAKPSLMSMSGDMLALMNMLEEADAEPTSAQRAAVRRTLSEFAALVARWNVLRATDVPAVNAALRAGGSAAGVSP